MSEVHTISGMTRLRNYFLTGFIARDDENKEAWGRPVGLLQLRDGSLLVSDDGGNRIWRVSYGKK